MILVTIFAAVVYGAIQHVFRMSANDPQIQLAQDTAQLISRGKDIKFGDDKVDIAKSLAPYIVVFDSSLKPTLSSGVLDGKMPVLPQGVFDYAGKNGENRFTWQPKSGVRSAVVLVSFSGKKQGFVMAGRSLREVEKREDDLLIEVGTGWVAALVFATLPFLIRNRKIS